MRSQDYGRVWDLITQEPYAIIEDMGPSSSLCNHKSTPASASSEVASFNSERKRKAADDADTHTPSKRGSSLRTTLTSQILNMLPAREPGMFPAEIAGRLLEGLARHTEGLHSGNIQTHVRITLKDLWNLGKVSRISGKGPNGGPSHRYVRCNGAESDRHMGSNEQLAVALPVSQPPASLDFVAPTEPVHGEATSVTNFPHSHLQSGEAPHGTHDFQRHATAELPPEPERVDHSIDTSAEQHEQAHEGQLSDPGRETDGWTDEARDIVRKVRAAQALVVRVNEATSELSTLETRQSQAQSQRSVLQTEARERETARERFLAEAQTLRKQAVEAERNASVCQQDVERLTREAEDRKADLERCTTSLASAKNESAQLAEQLQCIKAELRLQ